MHAHDRAVDHLHVAVVRFHDGIHQAIPDSRLAPAVEAIVGRRVGPYRSGMSRHGAPVRSTQKMPLSTRRFFFGLTPRRFLGSSGSMTLHSKSVRS